MPATKGISAYVESQFRYWQQQKMQINTAELKSSNPFVTISREYGSGGYDVAEKLAALLNAGTTPAKTWAAYDRQIIERVIEDTGLSSALIDTLTLNSRSQMVELIQTSFSSFPTQVTVYRRLVEIIGALAVNGNVIIVGRAGNAITRRLEGGYHVRIVAPLKWKAEQLSEKSGIGKIEAERLIMEKSALRDNYMRDMVKFDISNPHNYNLVVNNEKHAPDGTAKIIFQGMKSAGLI